MIHGSGSYIPQGFNALSCYPQPDLAQHLTRSPEQIESAYLLGGQATTGSQRHPHPAQSLLTTHTRLLRNTPDPTSLTNKPIQHDTSGDAKPVRQINVHQEIFDQAPNTFAYDHYTPEDHEKLSPTARSAFIKTANLDWTRIQTWVKHRDHTALREYTMGIKEAKPEHFGLLLEMNGYLFHEQTRHTTLKYLDKLTSVQTVEFLFSPKTYLQEFGMGAVVDILFSKIFSATNFKTYGWSINKAEEFRKNLVQKLLDYFSTHQYYSPSELCHVIKGSHVVDFLLTIEEDIDSLSTEISSDLILKHFQGKLSQRVAEKYATVTSRFPFVTLRFLVKAVLLTQRSEEDFLTPAVPAPQKPIALDDFYGLHLPGDISFFGPDETQKDLAQNDDFVSAFYRFMTHYKQYGLLNWLGLPDLHLSAGTFTGSLSIFDGRLFPQLLGPDIACGMQVLDTGLSDVEFPFDDIIESFKQTGVHTSCSNPLDIFNQPFSSPFKHNTGIANQAVFQRHLPTTPAQGNYKELLAKYTDPKQTALTITSSLGTIGSGNHFVEIAVAQDSNPELGIKKGNVIIIIHSGSRRFGSYIQGRIAARMPKQGFELGTPEHDEVMQLIHLANIFAYLNRTALAERVTQAVHHALKRNIKFEPILDIPHDTLHVDQGQSYHRKGLSFIPTAPAPYLLAGDAAHGSFIMMAAGNLLDVTQQSLSHGTGRAFSRADAKLLLEASEEQQYLEDVQTSYEPGSKLSEMPSAYRDLDPVVQYFMSQGWITNPINLKPIVSIKD
jgi:release factor H-coupled RctB family protein